MPVGQNVEWLSPSTAHRIRLLDFGTDGVQQIKHLFAAEIARRVDFDRRHIGLFGRVKSRCSHKKYF
jgi:hypothetical protein